MKKRNSIIIFILCVILISTILGITIRIYYVSSAGIYYAKIDSKTISETVSNSINNQTCFSYSSLHYGGHIYLSNTNIQITNSSDLESMLGKELGTVYGNQYVKWSTDKEELASSSLEGALYEIKGYNSSYLIAIVYKVLTTSDTIIKPFERLNDIHLRYGSDLYKERMHVDQCSNLYGINTKDERYTGIFDKEIWKPLTTENSIVESLLSSLYNSKFVEITDDIKASIENSHCVVLEFCNDNGLSIMCYVYDNGYVSYSNIESTFLVKVDLEYCKEIIEYINSN